MNRIMLISVTAMFIYTFLHKMIAYELALQVYAIVDPFGKDYGWNPWTESAKNAATVVLNHFGYFPTV